MNEFDRALTVRPTGYIPLPYEPKPVRSLYELRNDFVTDTETWMDDLMETLKEQELSSEERYEQIEDLRIMQYNIDSLPEGSENRGFMQAQMDQLMNRYIEEQTEAEERAEARFVEEVKRHYVASLHFLVDEKHQPIGDPDVLDAELLQESLLEGYQPAPYEKKEIRDIDELRDEYEDEYGYPIDEENWTKQMQDVVTEEVMPYSLVYDQMEQLRKIQYQIDKLDEDENLAAMEEPFDLPELEEDLLTPEELETAKRDQQYKAELNRRYEKKCQLVDDLESLADLISENQIEYEDQIDARMEEEYAKREEGLKNYDLQKLEEQKLQREQAELQRQQEEERIERERIQKEILKEQRRRQAEEDQAALEEMQREAQREQQERDRRREEYIRQRNKELDEQANKIFLERVRKAEEDRRREEWEKQYREEQEKRMRAQIDRNPREMGEEPEDGSGFSRAPKEQEKDGNGVGLDQLLNEEEAVYQPGDIDLGAASGNADDFFEKNPLQGDAVIPAGQDGDFFERMPVEAPFEMPEQPNLNELLVDADRKEEKAAEVKKAEEKIVEEKKEEKVEEKNAEEKNVEEKKVEEKPEEKPEEKMAGGLMDEEKKKEVENQRKEELFKVEENKEIRAEDKYPLPDLKKILGSKKKEYDLQSGKLIIDIDEPFDDDLDLIDPDEDKPREEANEVEAEQERKEEQFLNSEKLSTQIERSKEDALQHLTEGQRELLADSERFFDLQEMFDTKKRFRWLGNTNSDEYKAARNEFREYLSARNSALGAIAMAKREYIGGRISEEAYIEQVQNAGKSLDAGAEKLQRAMKTYAVCATGGRDGQLGDKKIEDMTQDTGAARLASAMNVYEAIAQARAKDGFQTEPLSEARRQERVKETSFEEMYKKKFGDIQNESNRHRRAATYAQSEMKRTQAEQARQPEAPAHKKN